MGGVARRRNGTGNGERLDPIWRPGQGSGSSSLSALGSLGPALDQDVCGDDFKALRPLPAPATSSSNVPGLVPPSGKLRKASKGAVEIPRIESLESLRSSLAPSSTPLRLRAPAGHSTLCNASSALADSACGVAGGASVSNGDRVIGASGTSNADSVGQRENNAARCQAVASLQRLFFEEVARGGDPNAAAANALLRLAEESKPAGDSSGTSPRRSQNEQRSRSVTPRGAEAEALYAVAVDDLEVRDDGFDDGL